MEFHNPTTCPAHKNAKTPRSKHLVQNKSNYSFPSKNFEHKREACYCPNVKLLCPLFLMFYFL